MGELSGSVPHTSCAVFWMPFVPTTPPLGPEGPQPHILNSPSAAYTKRPCPARSKLALPPGRRARLRMDGPPQLVVQAKARQRLQYLYHGAPLPSRGPQTESPAAVSAPAEAPVRLSCIGVAALVPVKPLPGTGPPAAAPEAHEPWLAADSALAQRLQCIHGSWLLVQAEEAGPRAVVAQLLVCSTFRTATPCPAPGEQPAHGGPQQGADKEEASSGQQGAVPSAIASPLLAFNLGLPYTVLPFLSPPAAYGWQPAPPASPALLHPHISHVQGSLNGGLGAADLPTLVLTLHTAAPLRVQALDAALCAQSLHGLRPAAPATSATTKSVVASAVPAAASVVLGKVGRPAVTPLAKAAQPGSPRDPNRAHEAAAAGEAAGPRASSGAAGPADRLAEDGGGGAEDSSGSVDDVAEALRRHFTDCPRCAQPTQQQQHANTPSARGAPCRR
jgi:hypothetical protein